MAIKEKLISYIFFRPKGLQPDVHKDEYGLTKLVASNPKVNIYRGFDQSDLIEGLSKMTQEFRVYKYRSIFQIPFTFSANRGYLVENYFLKTISKSHLSTYNPDKASVFVLPATPYMYYLLVQVWWKLLQLLRIKPNPKKDGEFEFNEKRKREEYFLRGAIAKAADSRHFNGGKNHVYFSSKLGTEFLQKVNDDLFRNGILVVNSSDANRGYFNPVKDVSSVCMKDFKIPKYAYDISAFDKPFAKRKHLCYYAGMIYGKRKWVYDQRTNDCCWIDHHIKFDEYLLNYSRAKYYFHFPGSSEWSPRLFEGMWFGAVPVVLYDQYHLPFSDLLDWSKFAVLIHMKDIQRTYEIIQSVTEEQWDSKRAHLKEALKHFAYHKKPILGDAFYMTMYSIHNRMQ